MMEIEPIEWPNQMTGELEVVTHEHSCPQWMNYMKTRFTNKETDEETHMPIFVNGTMMRVTVTVWNRCPCGKRHFSHMLG